MQLKLSSNHIYVYNTSVDFRKSIDGLYALIHTQFETTINEDIFIFFNRARDKIKILAWHGNGFVLLYKRLEQGRFKKSTDETGCTQLTDKQLSWLVAGLDWVAMSTWNELEYHDFY